MAPPPSSVPPPEKPVGAEPSLSFLPALVFGGIFLVGAALIFGLALRSGAGTEPEKIPAATTAVATQLLPLSLPPPMPKLPLAYPATRTVNAADTYFGVTVKDPYRWLEDGKSPEVKEWLGAENALARSYLDALPGRAALEKRYGELLHIETISAPERAGDYVFFMKRRPTDEKAILYWRLVADTRAVEHVLLDPNQFIGTDNASLGDISPTLDGHLLAYTLRPNNADEATLYVKDVATGRDLPGEVITGAKYASPSWMPDGSGFVYTYLPPADPAAPQDRPGLAEVRYHQLGTDPKDDPVLHGKTGDPTKFIGASVSRDGKFLFFVQQNGWDKNDLYYQPLEGRPTAALAKTWRPIVVGQPFLYSLEAWQGEGYILTNEDATRYRLFKVSLANPARARWREIIPESPTRVLQGVAVIGGRLLCDELENVSSRIEIRDLDGALVRPLDQPGIGSVSELAGEPEHPEIYYGFASFTQPPEIFQTSVDDPAQTLWARINIPVDPSPYVVEQKFFSSKDGTKVPMFIVHRRDMPLDGSTPFLIYGYGGFGLSQTPFFSPGFYPFLEAGGGYALVNLRGGGEFGEAWHQDGMLLKKQNVFDDCIAAAEYLIAQGYTKPQRLALRGGSNGGLLVGAVLTQRPDLFRAMVCEVPLLDMIRFDQFGSGQTWVPEYGSPENEAQFKALYAYSPYHHVVPGTAYPSVLFCSAANDDRVDPMHARKMAAELQADTGSANPILLRVETQSGHGGGDQVAKTIVLATDIWGFLIHELGARTPGTGPVPAASH
jgi:prolyl oligopeptidase